MTQQRNYHWLLIVQFYLAIALWGAVQVGPHVGSMMYLASACQASAAGLWVVLDARASGRPMLRVAQELHCGFWPIAVPIYLLRSRGIRRGLLLLVAHVVGIFCINLMGYYVAIYSLYGVDVFMPPRFQE